MRFECRQFLMFSYLDQTNYNQIMLIQPCCFSCCPLFCLFPLSSLSTSSQMGWIPSSSRSTRTWAFPALLCLSRISRYTQGCVEFCTIPVLSEATFTLLANVTQTRFLFYFFKSDPGHFSVRYWIGFIPDVFKSVCCVNAHVTFQLTFLSVRWRWRIDN